MSTLILTSQPLPVAVGTETETTLVVTSVATKETKHKPNTSKSNNTTAQEDTAILMHNLHLLTVFAAADGPARRTDSRIVWYRS